jgi:pseudaminic acid cytidylyltransferase
MNLCVIPARGGSKRIPRKNIKMFLGKPIIAYSIEAAINSSLFEEIIVSTDDEEIAEIARRFGANVPFVRPEKLANDFTGTAPVIQHAIQWFQEKKQSFDQVCCIYPTAPFLKPDYIRQGYDQLIEVHANFSISVTTYPYPVQRAVFITEQGRLEMGQPEFMNTRTQDLPEAFHDAAQFYWGQAQAWLKETALFTSGTVPVALPRHLVCDIDTPDDWAYAEILANALQMSSSQ